MEELLSTLNEEKATVMKDLLESVQTPRLKAAFDKYLPAVLNNITEKKVSPAKGKAVLAESVKEVTGDKTAVKQVEVDERNNVIELRRLAGL
jgi:pheromone shutdown protein TraB